MDPSGSVYAMLHRPLIVEVASAKAVSKALGLMAGTPDPSAFVCLVLYTGFVHLFWAAAAETAR